MKKTDMTSGKAGITLAVVFATCFAQGAAQAQVGNPWNPASASGGASGNATSRYAPADLEQKLSLSHVAAPAVAAAVPTQMPVAPVQRAAPQRAAPQSAPVPLAAPVPNKYPQGGYPPTNGYGYAGVPQGVPGYAPNYGAGAYPGYGSGFSSIPGGYPGNNGGNFPGGGFLPGNGTPFGFSPFGFF